jgi:primosomal protein N'
VYLYSFDRFFGFDKICLLAETTDKKKVKTGDLLVIGNQYFLCIWKNLAFAEQYQHLTTVQAELVYKWFLSLSTLKLFHWMVESYYTTYKSVVRLFVAHDIQKLLERENKLKAPSTKHKAVLNFWNFSCAKEGQTLIVFPDIRTLFNTTDEIFRESDGVACLLAGNTEKQKDVHRWEIKKWLKSVILCTYAEIFQDFHNLKKIIFVDPHKWYYASQQDPRYKVGDVIEEMQKLYGAELEIVGI